tara:strand:- start:511 stop:900 length:390 start_codon:yes stop_codon:yes gene_type:complete
MAVKVLVTAIGQHVIAETKQIENKESKEVVGYWLGKPRVVFYGQDEETKEIQVNFGAYCLVSAEEEFSVRADHVVSILEPRADVVEGYNNFVNPPAPEVELTDDVNLDGEVSELSSDTAEDGTSPGLTD